MLNPRITASMSMPIGGEIDTSDLQGIGLYRGKEVKKSRLENEFDFGVTEESDNQDGKSATSAKGELKNDAQKKEQDAFSEHQQNLPDFNDFSQSPGFQKFMAQLRRSQRGGDYNEIKEALDTTFQDPSLKNAALSGAIKLLESQSDDPELKTLLQHLLHDLTEQSGAEIRAGYNVSNIAASIAGDGTDIVAALRDFYCEVVFGNQDLVSNYHFIMSSFPDLDKVKRDQKQRRGSQQEKEEENPDGREGQERLEKALEFLLKSLAAELTSNAPSLEPLMLKSVMDGMCQMEFFRNAYRSFLQMLTKMNINCALIPVKPSRLIDEILGRVTKDTFTDDEFLRIAEKFSVPPLQLSIEFLTRIYEMIRLFPERIFANPQSRDNCLKAVQHSLDAAIARESEVAL